ncbi:MAG TPA: TRAP transporter small permease [Bordetella sp.]|nr:TRAP transporter small permease [Bordetella sp.]
MRKILDGIYDGCAWLAALCLVGTLTMVLLTIVGRLLNFNVPGSDAYAGFSMAGAGFLAMAHTLKHNEHIRVTLIIGKLAGRSRRFTELWALSVGVILAALLAFYSVHLCLGSYAFNDRSSSSDNTPLWIPQILMALGAIALLMALLDELVLEVRGQRVMVQSEEAHYE